MNTNTTYSTHRTHQGIDGKTPIPLPEYPPTTMANTKLRLILNKYRLILCYKP